MTKDVYMENATSAKKIITLASALIIALTAYGCSGTAAKVKKEAPASAKTSAPKTSGSKKVPGTAQRKINASENALKDFRKGLELSATNPNEAIKNYSLALAKEPGFAEARYNLGLLYMKLGDAQKGKSEFVAAIEGGSRLPELFNALGVAYAREKQFDAAKNSLTYAASTGHSADALTNLANVYLIEGNEPLADETYERALLLLSEDPYANYNAGVRQLKGGDYKGAAVRLKKSTAMGDNTPQPWLAYAEAVFMLGDYNGAAGAYEHVLRLHPNISQARINLGILYELYLNDLGKAAEHYNAYVSLNAERSNEVKEWLDVLKAKSTPQ